MADIFAFTSNEHAKTLFFFSIKKLMTFEYGLQRKRNIFFSSNILSFSHLAFKLNILFPLM